VSFPEIHRPASSYDGRLLFLEGSLPRMPDFNPSASDFYERLGVPPSADADEVRKAYRKAARRTHPDRNPNDARAALRFRRIREAYEVLSDEDARSTYDRRRASSVQSTGLTAAPKMQAGCMAYAAWRILVGVIAAVIFVALEMAGLWELNDAESTTWVIIGAVVVAGTLAFLAAYSFEDKASDYEVRFRSDDVTVYVQGHPWARIRWGDVHRLVADLQRDRVELRIAPSAAESIREQRPVLPSVVPADGEVRLLLDLSGTDVPAASVLRFAQTLDGVRSTVA